MSNICINTLIGIPASGKTTFCRKIESEAKIFNVIHICYDNFIKLPDISDSSTEETLYFQSKQYKKQRFSLMWLIQQLIEDIKKNTQFSKFNQTLVSEFPNVSFDVKFDPTKKNYLFLIDDTMHYKSMRKELRTIARNHELGFFVTFFHSTLHNAISRNHNRSSVVDEKHLQRIFDVFEPPTDEDGEIIHINIDQENIITTNLVELFALKCINSPLKIVQCVINPPIEQTKLHKVDLILRKSINSRMKEVKEVKESNVSINLRKFAKVLCDKRLFILNEIKMGRIVLPENLDDLGFLID